MLKLTAHAARRLQERRIAVAWVVATIETPDWIGADTDPDLTRSYKAVEEYGGRILRVVHRPDGADILVITALFDRSAT